MLLSKAFQRAYDYQSIISLQYRVEHQTLPVEFLLNFYCMLQDMNLKIGTDNPLVLSYDMIKA